MPLYLSSCKFTLGHLMHDECTPRKHSFVKVTKQVISVGKSYDLRPMAWISLRPKLRT